MERSGFWVDLQGLTFSDSEGSWIQALPHGDYTHPVYGEIKITPDRVQRFASNIKSKVRGIDPDIDYDHKALTKEAAGWVKDAEARSDGLWLFVEWTKSAAGKLKEKAYRYFSAEIADQWEHPKSRTVFRDVLLGGALTNRPFVKDILPINFSEIFESDNTGGSQPLDENQGGVTMDAAQLKALAVKLGLKDDATEAEVVKAFSEWTPPQTTPTPPTPTPPVPPAPTPTPQQLLSEGEMAAYAKLAESSPGVGQLLAVVQQQQKALAEGGKSIRLSEVNNALGNASIGKSYALTPQVKDALRDILLEVPQKFTEPLCEAIADIVGGKGLVPLGESSVRRNYDQLHGSATQRFNELVANAQKAGATYADACTVISSQQPKLFEEYRAEATAWVE